VIAGRQAQGLRVLESLPSSIPGRISMAKSTRVADVDRATLTLLLLHRQIISFKFNRAIIAIPINMNVRNMNGIVYECTIPINMNVKSHTQTSCVYMFRVLLHIRSYANRK